MQMSYHKKSHRPIHRPQSHSGGLSHLDIWNFIFSSKVFSKMSLVYCAVTKERRGQPPQVFFRVMLPLAELAEPLQHPPLRSQQPRSGARGLGSLSLTLCPPSGGHSTSIQQKLGQGPGGRAGAQVDLEEDEGKSHGGHLVCF